MPARSNIWALVLAAGDGKRLDRLTRVYGGRAIPKRYCSLRAGPSLLHDALRRALAVTAHRDRAEAGAARAVTELYASLRPVDFSHDILPGQESSIRVVRVPLCGWSDLGTPERVGRTLAHMPTERMPTATWTRQLDAPVSPLSLAEQHARQANARLQPDRVNHRQ